MVQHYVSHFNNAEVAGIQIFWCQWKSSKFCEQVAMFPGFMKKRFGKCLNVMTSAWT